MEPCLLIFLAKPCSRAGKMLNRMVVVDVEDGDGEEKRRNVGEGS